MKFQRDEFLWATARKGDVTNKENIFKSLIQRKMEERSGICNPELKSYSNNSSKVNPINLVKNAFKLP